MRRQDFFYELPKELIAQEPRPRGASRMLVVEPRSGPPALRHENFARFPELLGERDLVVINDTKVFPARLFAAARGQMKRPLEFLLTRRLGPLRWESWGKPARRIRPGACLHFSERLEATVVEKQRDGVIILDFHAGEEREFWSELQRVGVTPLPPYIVRPTPRAQDRESYQTVYAAREGAIAAPTAGLHFNEEILQRIGHRLLRITLHVGIGTFKPVKVDRIEEHIMDAEQYEISGDAARRLNDALATQRRIVAVGTTTVRALESAVRAGDGRFLEGSAEATLFINPGFSFKVVDSLLTNFHLPESTLLMLVSAFAGLETIRRAYREAIAERYRFYSYGDCMFITHRGAW